MALTQAAYNEMLEELLRMKQQNAELLAALKALMARAQFTDDVGPVGAGWQSDELVTALARARDAIARTEKP